jgi:solute carrier family 35, member F5
MRSAFKRQREHGDLYDTIRLNVLRIFGKDRKGRGRHRRVSLGNENTIDEGDEYHDDEAGVGEDGENDTFLRKSVSNNEIPRTRNDEDEAGRHLPLLPTARLALAFCVLWFSANYFAMACLEHTSVASVTILTSTSSFWTLLIGAFTGTEKFTWRKLCGVLGSFVGIILISRVDLGGARATDAPSRLRLKWRRDDTFPDKSPSELALGDALALFSAILYGIYTITLKKATLRALPRSLNMPLFFGLVGVFNFILLSPLFPILHYTGLERFKLPPTGRIWTILLFNSVASLSSDICWAYAMVLTSPLLVTVGLSLTIPLSLVGEMVLQGHYEGWVYWLGAVIVVGSFLFVDGEEKREEMLMEGARVGGVVTGFDVQEGAGDAGSNEISSDLR